MWLLPPEECRSYGALNASAELAAHNDVKVSGKNLIDKAYANSIESAATADMMYYALLRTYGVSLTTKS